MNIYLEILINAIFSFAATVGFGLIINLPRRALILCGVSGMCGWMMYFLLSHLGMGAMMSNLGGAFLVGILGIFFARWKKMPIINFNIPGIVPLVPGATAYQAVRQLVLGDLDEAMRLLLKVAIVCGAIAIGFLLAQSISEILSRIRHARKRRRQEAKLKM